MFLGLMSIDYCCDMVGLEFVLNNIVIYPALYQRVTLLFVLK